MEAECARKCPAHGAEAPQSPLPSLQSCSGRPSLMLCWARTKLIRIARPWPLLSALASGQAFASRGVLLSPSLAFIHWLAPEGPSQAGPGWDGSAVASARPTPHPGVGWAPSGSALAAQAFCTPVSASVLPQDSPHDGPTWASPRPPSLFSPPPPGARWNSHLVSANLPPASTTRKHEETSVVARVDLLGPPGPKVWRQLCV